MKTNKYTSLSELDYHFRTGYIIIDNTLFLLNGGFVSDSWELESTEIDDKVAEARAVAELSTRKRIVVDDENCYNADTVSDEGELITESESWARLLEEERDDYDSFAEYFL